jgi:cell division protein FtsB
MRIRRSVTRFFSALVIPAICGAAVAYFGYYTVWGPRGLVALDKVHAQLAVHQDQLSALRARHDRLAHRIKLLQGGSADPDLVEELANQQLMEGIPGQVAIPRHPHR